MSKTNHQIDFLNLDLSGIKHDEQKLRFDLISPAAMKSLAEILTMGANKYQPRNWERGIVYSRVLAALLRHLNQYQLGEKIDQESQKSHLAHAFCNLMFLVHYDCYPEKYSKFQDII